jgi:putative inorganic carbon (HCO3(-)) transporter
MGASLINHENVSDGLSSLCELISYTALYFLMVKTIRTERGLIRIAISLMIIITYFALEGLYRLFITKSIWRLGAGDVNTATNMGAFMFQALILLLASRIIIDQKQSKESKVAYTIILGSIIFAFVFTYSRGAWITLLVGGLILMHKRSKAIILAILLFIIIFPFLPKEISNRFLSTFNTKNLSFIELYRGAQINNTTYLRLANWSNTLDDIVEHPMLGVGVGYYHGEEKGEDAPHNTYLRLWAEGGPVALAGFLWFLASLVYSFVSSSQTAKGRSNWLLMGFYSVVLTHIFYLFLGDWAYQIYFWVFAGLSTATLKIYHHLYVIKHLQKETGHKAISS